jgi:toxin CptA
VRIVIASLAFLIAAVCAGVMGYAIQRGATCMVAAVDEVVSLRRATRLVALGEAALWVTGGLFIAHALGILRTPPSGFALTIFAAVGGALLGAGALLNRACVFGTIARFGSGEWAYAVTPLGFFVGCLTVGPLVAEAMPTPVHTASPLFALPIWAAVALSPLLAWRAYVAAQAARNRGLVAHVWSPHLATAIIGLAFVVMLLTVGGWAYTELLADWARGGMTINSLPRGLLFLLLLVGAVAGGWTSRRIGLTLPPLRSLLRCFCGGWLMGMGSLLIPGGNDGLILIGVPLFQPHAWVATGSMAATIAASLLIRRNAASRLVRASD